MYINNFARIGLESVVALCSCRDSNAVDVPFFPNAFVSF